MSRWTMSGVGSSVEVLREALERKQRLLQNYIERLARAETELTDAKALLSTTQREIDEIQAAMRILSGRRPKLVDGAA